ncbi:MAG: hypothetical protein KatS3mg030_297 [Saprospiraceae bacterium]|nr:MAG: hypothetical protein KatS3mg030_297 [Saprospiraceae bacterium]
MNETANFAELMLGTAMWGWTVPPEQAFLLLDRWYEQGMRRVDTATNYPIDKVPEHFRLAERILAEWIRSHGVHDLAVTVKVGSLNNLYTPDHLLTTSFILMMFDEYAHAFGKNLHTLMVHWDNRDEIEAIRETFEAFKEVASAGVHPGLSGIRHPGLYAKLNAEYGFDFSIQIKHNLFYSDYPRYAPFHGRRRFWAYGINAGGVKLPGEPGNGKTLSARGIDASSLADKLTQLQQRLEGLPARSQRPQPKAMFQLGLTWAALHPDMAGVLVGPSNVDQLQQCIDWWRALQRIDFSDVYQVLSEFHSEATQ